MYTGIVRCAPVHMEVVAPFHERAKLRPRRRCERIAIAFARMRRVRLITRRLEYRRRCELARNGIMLEFLGSVNLKFNEKGYVGNG